MNNEFQRMWEEAIICIVAVELDDMANGYGLLVKIWDDGECFKHLVSGQQLQIDYRPETTSVEKADVAESGYSIGSVIMN